MNTSRDTKTRPVVATGALAFSSALLLAACGTADEGNTDNAENGSIDPFLVAIESDTFEAQGTVLQGPDDEAPQLCQVVQHSLPPQCSGIDLEGWDWDDVNHESEADHRWGEYTVTGTYDGQTFTLTEDPRENEVGIPVEDEDGVTFTTPCSEPDGGWEPEDTSLTSDEALHDAMGLATQRDEFAGQWIDNNSTLEGENDVESLIYNVTATENLDEIESELRGVWGGNLCVSEAKYTHQELLEIQATMEEELSDSFIHIGVNEVENHVEVEVTVVSTQAQADIDERFGEGAVEFNSWLRPVK
ncbi:hypothetical protein [Natronoglycomyces albus]|uniref:Uncharacterized protein n=1 Tax=Natronoglycomyces albus TaxID=2811108 RepID=A0A895XKP3_9ACTN|nr:hypothetical protein [Natronoglycomyces albus]QSB04133.1 hypothetical protein JQS30_09935 [Natronoglycomyces albus]